MLSGTMQNHRVQTQHNQLFPQYLEHYANKPDCKKIS